MDNQEKQIAVPVEKPQIKEPLAEPGIEGEELSTGASPDTSPSYLTGWRLHLTTVG
jgi:hypothetical protein